MNAPVRVMLVDDSSAVRRMLSAALSVHEEIRVVGSAENGLIALERIPQLSPELVILDVEMPEMDGITTLEKLRERWPTLPVIMFSTLTERGAKTTFDALAKGASDYVLKPSSNGENLAQVVSTTLLPRILGLTRSRLARALQAAAQAVDTRTNGMAGLARNNDSTAVQRPQTHGPASNSSFPQTSGSVGGLADLRAANSNQGKPTAQSAARLAPMGKSNVQIIAIAASTGGPNALSEVLPLLPAALPVPVVIVQHMPALFTRCLAERLNERCAVRVLESAGNERLAPGTIYIAPGSRHLDLVRDASGVYTLLTDAQPENSCRPSADVLFRAVARVYGSNALGVVLTGMGQDGLQGARELQQVGGRIVVQSGPTCVIWGMPKAVEEAGIAEAVVPLPQMAEAIMKRVGMGLIPLRAKEAL